MNKKEQSTKEKLTQKISVFTETIWQGKVQGKDVKAWLDNFEDNEDEPFSERLNSLYLLSKFMYFGNDEVRELLKCLFRDKVKYPIIQKIRQENGDTTNEGIIRAKFNEIMKRSKFLGVGNPSESGIHLLYYFRQENNLPKTIFINSGDIFSKDSENLMVIADAKIEAYYFIDDFCGSGKTALSGSTKETLERIKSLSSSIQVNYISLFATEEGLRNIRTKSKFDRVDSVFLLDDSYKCFETDSRYYKEDYKEINQKFAKETCVKYKTKLKTKKNKTYNPFGFSGSQLLIGLFHNTPNNTLPIFWHSEKNNWTPIFKRYPKNYGNE